MLTDQRTQIDILNNMIEILTKDMAKEDIVEIHRTSFNTIVQSKFNKYKFPKMDIQIVTK